METRPYRPSNGTEGRTFETRWCNKCARFEAEEGEYCPILGDVYCLQADDPFYPKEWVTDEERGPRCTAFTTDPAQPARCLQTADLFAAASEA